MEAELRSLVMYLWVAVGIVWLVGWLFAKKSARSEGLGSQLIQLVQIAVAFWLVFGQIGYPPLHQRFIPDNAFVVALGFAVTVIGLMFKVWARLYLGRNWSGVVTIKHDHDLVRTGPYALVRHPIYTGLLVALAGTAVVIGEVRGLLGVFIAMFALWQKSRLEDRFLSEQFGAAYRDYRSNVRALIPFLL